MFWSVTLSLLFGIWASAFLPMCMEWGVLVSLFAYVVSWMLIRGKRSASGVLLLGVFSFAVAYGQARRALADDGVERGSGKAVSEYVRRAESSLAQTNLSDDHQHLLGAMLLGDRERLTKEQKTLFRMSGSQHLLALSGVHLGILFSLINLLVLRRVRFTRWRWPVLFATLFFLWSYALVVGMPKSLMRAGLMLTLYQVGHFSYRDSFGHEILSSTIFLMLLIDPLSAFDIGAQLSVAALTGMTCFAPLLANFFSRYDVDGSRIPPRWPWAVSLWKAFAFSFSAWLFTMPLTMFYFGQFQVWQPLVGVFLVPAVSLMLYPAVVLIALSIAGVWMLALPLSTFLDGFMSVVELILKACASLPASSVTLPHATLWHVGLLYFLFAILGVAMRYPSRRIALLSALLVILTLAFFAFLKTV